jgi:hypothetical protein
LFRLVAVETHGALILPRGQLLRQEDNQVVQAGVAGTVTDLILDQDQALEIAATMTKMKMRKERRVKPELLNQSLDQLLDPRDDKLRKLLPR